MAKIPEFKFDFEAIEGMELTDGMAALFGQLEAHYNKHIKPAPILFGGKRISAPQFTQEFPTTPAEAKAADKPKPTPKGMDLETITPTTVSMKTFVIRDSAAGDRKMIVGTDEKGSPVNDLLLYGYDEEPYGPVVSGESGRYNLKGK